MEQLPLYDLEQAGAQVTDMLAWDGDQWSPAVLPPRTQGKFRGEWAPDELVWSDNFAGGVDYDRYTASYAGIGSAPEASTPGAAGQPGAPAYADAVIFPNGSCYVGSFSALSLALAGLGIANITRVRSWLAHQTGLNADYKVGRISKNGVTQWQMQAPFAWRQVEVAASSSDTVTWVASGNVNLNNAVPATVVMTGVEVYAAPDPYMTGEFVTYQGKMWRSNFDNNASTPGANLAWSETSIGSPALNPQTGTSYLFATSDASKLVTFTNASPVTANLPANAAAALVVGTKIQVANLGAGTVTMTPASGVVLRKEPGASYTFGQYQGGTLTKLGIDDWLWQPTAAPASGGGGGSALTVRDEGVALDAAVADLDFIGAGVTATYAAGKVTVSIPGSTGGGGGDGAVLYDAKGDILIGQANDTPARLALGSDGQVLTTDSTAPLGVKWAAPAAGSGGGSSWNSRFAEAGDSLANWTVGGAGGTWTVVSGVLHCIHSGTFPSRLRHNIKLPTGMVAMQADIRFTASGTDARAGFVIGFDGTAAGGILVRLHADSTGAGDKVETEVDTTAARMVSTMAWGAVNTWHTLRVVTGGGISTVYVDGTLIHSAGNNAQQSNNATYVGLLAGACTAEFRNITAWSPKLPWE